MDNRAIGVFDSGMGGLTVLSALREALPNESFIYLGDTARLPYGTKSPTTIRQYASQMARFLVEKDIKALVIACNSATTAALPHLQQTLPDIPIVMGVVEPGAMAAMNASNCGVIGLLATEATVQSKAYQKEIYNLDKDAIVLPQAANVLVALSEAGHIDDALAITALRHYLEPFITKNIDTLVLGCTHFPIFQKSIATILPAHIKIIDSAKTTSQLLKTRLKDMNLLQSQKTKQSRLSFHITDSIQRFIKIGPYFLRQDLQEYSISLIDIPSSY